MSARIAKLGNVKHDGKCKRLGSAETQRIKSNLNPKSLKSVLKAPQSQEPLKYSVRLEEQQILMYISVI